MIFKMFLKSIKSGTVADKTWYFIADYSTVILYTLFRIFCCSMGNNYIAISYTTSAVVICAMLKPLITVCYLYFYKQRVPLHTD